VKAIVQIRYGSVDDLELQEVPVPAVGDEDVLVRVRAASLHPDVWHVVTGRPYVLRLMGGGAVRPTCQIPGTDVAGIVERVGRRVSAFRPGDEVFGETSRGHPWMNGGAFAEYVSVPVELLASKPGNVTFEQAASVPTSGFIALFNLRDSTLLGAGRSVLINGAGGGVRLACPSDRQGVRCAAAAAARGWNDHTSDRQRVRAWRGSGRAASHDRGRASRGGGPHRRLKSR
jgi:NADPH:quinone reductase-like Zn-dependent oxidoreductase